MAESSTREETGSFGAVAVPADMYYGAQTARSPLNFPIGGVTVPRALILALGTVKRAAAQVNAEQGRLPQEIADAIDRAAAEIAKAAHANGTALREEALRLGYVSAAEFDDIVRPERMTTPA